MRYIKIAVKLEMAKQKRSLPYNSSIGSKMVVSKDIQQSLAIIMIRTYMSLHLKNVVENVELHSNQN